MPNPGAPRGIFLDPSQSSEVGLNGVRHHIYEILGKERNLVEMSLVVEVGARAWGVHQVR